MPAFHLKFIWVPLLLTFIISPFFSTSQGIQTDFGKSKVQFGKFDWYFYKTSSFEVYYNSGGKSLAQYVLTNAKKQLNEVEKILDYKASSRITIIIYNTYADFRQSNLTLSDEKYNIGGLTPVVDNLAFVYFDGDHRSFDKRLKQSIAEVLLNELLYGTSIQERLQNNALISIPEWFYKGLLSFISGNISPEDKEKFENGIETEKYKRFGRLKPEEKILIGHYFWEYIYTAYGKNAIGNILYLTHINKNIESGFDFVVGKPFNFIYNEWYKFYRYQVLSRETSKYDELKYSMALKKFARNGEIIQAKLSPDGEKIAYSISKNGKNALFIYDLNRQKKTKVFEKGVKSFEADNDKSYPVFDWMPIKNTLTYSFLKKGKPWLANFDPETRKTTDVRKLETLDRILSFSFNQRGTSLVISAIKDGNSDIFIYEVRSYRLFQITNDIFDDLFPEFINQDKGIIFSSNRNSIFIERSVFDPESNFSPSLDLYYYRADQKSRQLIKASYNDIADETMPQAYDSNQICYLTNENGIINRNAAYIDSIFNRIQVIVSYQDTVFKPDTFNYWQNDRAVVSIDPSWLKDSLIEKIDTQIIYHDTSYHYRTTNYLRNIRQYNIVPRTESVFELFRDNNSYQVSIAPFPEKIRQDHKRQSAENIPELYKTFKKTGNEFEGIENEETKEISVIPPVQTEKQKDSFSYYFINDFEIKIADTTDQAEVPGSIILKPADIVEPFPETDSLLRLRPTRFGSSSSYFLSFCPDYLVSQFDNSFLNSPYLVYNKDETPQPINRITSAFFMLGVNDLFKDYRIAGGVRLKGNLSGTEYIMAFENLKSRLDKKFIFYRKSETSDGLYVRYRQKTNEGRMQLRYPFNENASLRSDIFIRHDRKVTLSSEHNSLTTPDIINVFPGVKLEFVFDNSRQIAENIRVGTRYKIYFENFRNFSGFKNEFSVFGFDFRHYLRIHKELIWANRAVFATSFGGSKVVYLLGGIDNWLLPKYNSDIMIDPDINYVYKSLGVQMRGFTQNIRNGNSYALINSEIRFPVFKYFSSLPMKSRFFETFQLVAFTDIGTAWTGPSPYSEANTLNKQIIYNNPLKITVITVGEPVVGGFGFGIRTTLFGYYVKVDHAWGMEGGKIFQHITYLSLGVDF